MTRVVWIALFLAAAGCQSSGGGLLYRKPDRADDPMYSIEEQKARARERYGFINTQNSLAPNPYPPLVQ